MGIFYLYTIPHSGTNFFANVLMRHRDILVIHLNEPLYQKEVEKLINRNSSLETFEKRIRLIIKNTPLSKFVSNFKGLEDFDFTQKAEAEHLVIFSHLRHSRNPDGLYQIDDLLKSGYFRLTISTLRDPVLIAKSLLKRYSRYSQEIWAGHLDDLLLRLQYLVKRRENFFFVPVDIKNPELLFSLFQGVFRLPVSKRFAQFLQSWKTFGAFSKDDHKRVIRETGHEPEMDPQVPEWFLKKLNKINGLRELFEANGYRDLEWF